MHWVYCTFLQLNGQHHQYSALSHRKLVYWACCKFLQLNGQHHQYSALSHRKLVYWACCKFLQLNGQHHQYMYSALSLVPRLTDFFRLQSKKSVSLGTRLLCLLQSFTKYMNLGMVPPKLYCFVPISESLQWT